MTMFRVGLAAIAGLSIFIAAACGSDVPGPVGPPGPAGVPGPAGPPGPAGEVDDGVVRKSDIWPGLHYDGSLSRECREQIIDKTIRDVEGFRRFVYGGTEGLNLVLSLPFRSLSLNLNYEIRSVMVRLGEEFEEEVYPSRIEWESDEGRYYVISPDGARTDSTPKIPCAQDRERIERFNRVHWDGEISPMTQHIGRALDGFWRTCIPWPDPDDEWAIRTCDEYRLLYGWWLPDWPDDVPIQRPDG